MSILEAALLGLLQGLTEFLPVSSSGHLVIAQSLLGFASPPVAFDILVHLATALVIVIVLWPSLIKLSRYFIALILLASLPAAVVGLWLNQVISELFSSPRLVASALLITASLLFSLTFFIKRAKRVQPRPVDALLIGLFQALAILPGVSRSGSTISAGIYSGLSPQTSFTFSFILALPAILGAQALQLPALIGSSSAQVPALIVGFFAAFVSGYFALKILKKLVISARLTPFAWYCLALSGLILFSGWF
jgi:undecaprenyl-diphosphatase